MPTMNAKNNKQQMMSVHERSATGPFASLSASISNLSAYYIKRTNITSLRSGSTFPDAGTLVLPPIG